MKWTALVALTLAAVAVSRVAAEPRDIPITVRLMQDLHRAPPEPLVQTRANIETAWIEQKLDHFDDSETRTWQMRYMQNDEFWQPGGPIFMYFGGEWEIAPGMISGGHLYDMAKEHNGMLYYTEHRYYGKSRPTRDVTTENLRWLHVKQALADVAHFIRTKRATVEGMANSKVIISGGSYSATMVVWFKLLYPELAAGGWASSAPLHAKVDFREYKEVVGRSFLELGSQECYDRIQNGFAELEAMFAHKRGAEVIAMLKICSNFDENNDMDVSALFGGLSNVFSGIAQYQNEGEIPKHCDVLLQGENAAVGLVKFILQRIGSGRCHNFSYKGTLTYYMDSSYDAGISRAWYYQTCNEYGWYQSSGSRNQPFGSNFPALFYTTLCGDLYGAHFTNERIQMNVEQTNKDFFGKEIKVENVYQTHGALDPWHPMGLDSQQGATIIPRTSHCKDLGSISERDSPAMRASKERLAELVREWLAD